MMRTFFMALLALFCFTQAASAQFYPDRYGYAWYPRQYATGYYRAPYYGYGIPYRPYGTYGTLGYHPQPRRPAYVAPVRQYNRYWSPPRYYGGGLPGGGEW